MGGIAYHSFFNILQTLLLTAGLLMTGMSGSHILKPNSLPSHTIHRLIHPASLTPAAGRIRRLMNTEPALRSICRTVTAIW